MKHGRSGRRSTGLLCFPWKHVYDWTLEEKLTMTLDYHVVNDVGFVSPNVWSYVHAMTLVHFS